MCLTDSGNSMKVRSSPVLIYHPPCVAISGDFSLWYPGCSEDSSTQLAEFKSPASKNELSYKLYRLSSCKLQISLFNSYTPTLICAVPNLKPF